MSTKKDLEHQVVAAARENGISSALLRNAVSRRLGFSVTDMECLALLNVKGSASPTELARYTGLTPGSTTAMLNRLERAKLIKRKPNPTDRRGLLIEMKKHSMDRIGLMFAGAQKAQADLIASYSVSELTIIADFLTRFTQNVKNHTDRVEKGDVGS